MRELLPKRTQINVAVVAGAAALGTIQLAYSYATGQASSSWQWVSLGVTVILALAATVGNSLWFWLAKTFPIMQTAIFPDLNGIWTGQLQSTWIDAGTAMQAPPINLSVTIRQTLFTTTVNLTSETSSSRSVRVFLEADRVNRRYVIHHFYANEPRARARQQLSPHLGMASLECEWGLDRDKLTGSYFTDRKTTGDIELRRVGGLAEPPAAA